MTIFSDEDLANTPILTEWQIVGISGGQPQLFGRHAYHEGRRVACEEVIVVDPALRWAITTSDGYRLAGAGTLAIEYAKFGTQKRDN